MKKKKEILSISNAVFNLLNTLSMHAAENMKEGREEKIFFSRSSFIFPLAGPQLGMDAFFKALSENTAIPF